MESTLDRIDLTLVELLQKNARLTNKELAARVDLSPSSCLERVRRLNASGVFRGHHADVNPDALGLGLQAMIMVSLAQHSRKHVQAFRTHLLALREVVAIYHVGGSHDFLIHVAVRDAHHLRDLALDAFTSRPEVGRMETALIFEHARSFTLPTPLPPAPAAKRSKRT